MTAHDEVSLRQWLVDYLITTIGCSPDDVGLDTSMSDLGVGSRDSVVLSGELAELLGRPVSPVEFWEHPTVNALARYLTNPGTQVAVEAGAGAAGPERDALDEPIAVIGMGCRFPGGIDGPDSLWQFLIEGGNAVTEVPPDRWLPFDDHTPEVSAALAKTTRWGSYLTDLEAFDAEFFEISYREAAKMDPQQRLLLEVAWEALENAGIPPETLRHSQTGVFVGACISEYAFLASSDLPNVDAWSNTGGALSIIANRLSYFLDLRGPSLAVDTACSSSLVALHLACQSLRTNDSETAIVAGVNLLLSPAVFHGFDQAGALSPTGMCHSFDASADGFVRGEGCGAVILKRLGDAVRDGDRVLAVIRGTAVNSDGHSNGLMAPNPAAQMAVLRAAYGAAGVAHRDVDYVEAHGTGTLLGDPIEARALGTVLGRGRPAGSPLLVGAVKSNLGHLEAAAGIAGLIKTVLAVQRGEIPATRGYRTPNPHIAFDQLSLKVVAENQKWPDTGRVRRAGVSSFGFGGTNAHVVIEAAEGVGDGCRADGLMPAVSTLVVSGKSESRVARFAGVLADWMEYDGADVALADVAHALNHHRATHAHFATVCARDRADAIAGLRALSAGEPGATVVPPHRGTCGAGTVFVYSGQGSQWAGMGMRLLADEPAFAAAVAELEPVFTEQVGFSLRQVLTSGQAVSGDARVQPVLMGMHLALTALWRSYGVEPDAVIGHSMGEVSAAVVAGALSVADGLKVIATRSRLMSELAGQGAVALVRLDAESAAELIAGVPGMAVTVYASPRQTVVAGPVAQVDAVIAAAVARDVFARRVNMEVASHTAQMDPVLRPLEQALGDLTAKSPALEFFSTVIDSAAPKVDARYWAANVRQPVRLSRAVAAAAENHTTFVEISPHPTLADAIAETLPATGHHHVVATLSRDEDDTLSFHRNLNATHTTRPPDTAHAPGAHPVLPSAPWQHTHHWLPQRSAGAAVRAFGATDVDSSGPAVIPADWSYELVWHPQELAETAVAATPRCLLIGQDTLVQPLGHVLGDQAAVRHLPTSVLSDDTDQDVLRAALTGVDHVVYAPEQAPDTFGAAAGRRIFDAARRLVLRLSRAGDRVPRLHLLTRNAQPVAEGDRANPAHAVLWGLGRTLALEHPELWGGVVDVDESVPDVVTARYLVAEIRDRNTVDQVVYRIGRRHVPRLRVCAPPVRSDTHLDAAESHLVVGATGNIAPHLIRHLAARGAATIVAVSRNPGDRLRQLSDELAVGGATLVTVAADAADETAMAALFDRFGADLPPLGGIYLAAFGGGPATLADMTDDDVAAMFAPKLDAAAVLHRLSLSTAVRRFVVFSSISGLLGSRWLGHYAATTTYLDTFAYARRAAGLPATSVNWGLWKSLADNQSGQERQVTAESGLEPLPDSVAIEALWPLSAPGAAPRAVVVAADWPRLANAYRTRAPLHIVDDLVAPMGPEGADAQRFSAFLEELSGAAPERRRPMLRGHVSSLAARAMSLPSAHVLDSTTGFFQLGMDSLMSVTLQRTLSDSLGLPLAASVVFDYPTVDALSGHLADMLGDLFPQDAVGSEAFADFTDDAVLTDNYDDLSEDELLKELSERLS